MKTFKTETHSQPGPSDILHSITDKAGRRVTDLRKVADSPADYIADYAGTRASVETLLAMGIFRLQGNGSFGVDLGRGADFVEPQVQAKEPVANVLGPLGTAMQAACDKAGIDSSQFLASALTNPENAANRLAQGLSLEKTEAADLIEAFVRFGLEDVGNFFEQSGIVPEGQGQEVLPALKEQLSEKAYTALVAALMQGSRYAYQEATRLLVTGDHR